MARTACNKDTLESLNSLLTLFKLKESSKNKLDKQDLDCRITRLFLQTCQDDNRLRSYYIGMILPTQNELNQIIKLKSKRNQVWENMPKGISNFSTWICNTYEIPELLDENSLYHRYKYHIKYIINTLQNIITEYKCYSNPNSFYNKLIANQPPINKSEETFKIATEYMAQDIESYITYHAYKLVNAFGDVEDYKQDLYGKFYYMVNFYNERWFHSHKYNSKVVWKPMTYVEFLHLAKATISSEKRLKAFKFRTNPEASTHKISLDQKLTSDKTNNREINLIDVLSSEEADNNLLEQTHYNNIIEQAMSFAEAYEGGKYASAVQQLLIDPTQKCSKVERIVLKVSLYKAGLWESDKILKFIDNLSSKYKEKFGISQYLINKQKQELEKRRH